MLDVQSVSDRPQPQDGSDEAAASPINATPFLTGDSTQRSRLELGERPDRLRSSEPRFRHARCWQCRMNSESCLCPRDLGVQQPRIDVICPRPPAAERRQSVAHPGRTRDGQRHRERRYPESTFRRSSGGPGFVYFKPAPSANLRSSPVGSNHHSCTQRLSLAFVLKRHTWKPARPRIDARRPSRHASPRRRWSSHARAALPACWDDRCSMQLRRAAWSRGDPAGNGLPDM